MPKILRICFYLKTGLRAKCFYLRTVLRANAKQVFQMVWAICCITATMYTTIDQFRNYFNVEDQTIVEYRTFNEIETDLYPSISLCWAMSINEEKLKAYEGNFTATDYAKFLAGKNWDERMLMVDYDTVTPNFNDYVLKYGYKASHRDFVLFDKGWGKKLKPGFKDSSVLSGKCFTIDIPFRKGLVINGFYVFVKSSIFGKGGRLANPDILDYDSDENTFILNIHYPKQGLRRSVSQKYNWPFRGHYLPKDYVMRLTVTNIDVLVRRSTHEKPCTEGIPEYDRGGQEYILKRVKCKPPCLNNSVSTLDPCSEQKQLREIRGLIFEAMDTGNTKAFYTVKTPCRSLERIYYDGIDQEIPQRWMLNNPSFIINETVGLFFDFKESTYKEVKSVRGMGTQALIGKYTIGLSIDVNGIFYF